MCRLVYCFYFDRLRDRSFLDSLRKDYFNNIAQIRRSVDFIYDAKTQGLIHCVHIINTDELLNMLKLVPDVSGIFFAYLKKIIHSLVRICKLSRQLIHKLINARGEVSFIVTATNDLSISRVNLM
jgi:hypothetical protein